MLSLTDIKQAVDKLSSEERAELRAYIDKQQRDLSQEIDAIWQSAPHPHLTPGTMNGERLESAIAGMWSGLDDDDVDAVVKAMNEEYIETEYSEDE